MEGEGATKAPPLAEELLAVGGEWVIFRVVARPLVGCPCLGGWSQTHVHMDSTYTQLVIKREGKVLVVQRQFGMG